MSQNGKAHSKTLAVFPLLMISGVILQDFSSVTDQFGALRIKGLNDINDMKNDVTAVM